VSRAKDIQHLKKGVVTATRRTPCARAIQKGE
jgi:hypothetical protein